MSNLGNIDKLHFKWDIERPCDDDNVEGTHELRDTEKLETHYL
jgi:hypothetical protein